MKQLFSKEIELIEGQKRRVTVGCHMDSYKSQRPYFSVTGTDQDLRYQDSMSSGAIHETILQVFPELARIVALHLSDANGVPMHAEANGWHWAGGNRLSGTPNVGYLANHLRIDIGRAEEIVDDIASGRMTKEVFQAFVAEQMPRWQVEAEAGKEFLKTGVWPESDTSPAPGM